MRQMFCVLAVLVVVASAHSQDARYDSFYTNSLYVSNWNKLSSGQRLEAMRFTTPAYQSEAFGLVLAEANKAAIELQLQEKLPITKSNLLEVYIAKPITEIKGQGVGNISTVNYTYFVTAGNKLSSVVRQHHDEDLSQLVEEYRWPLSRMNTNAACKLALRWMKSAKVDVKKLSHDCQFFVEPVMFDDEGDTNHFVPIYHVSWKTPCDDQFKWHTMASVELFLPTKLLLDLTITDPKYILSKSLVVSNTDYMSNLVHAVTASH